MKRAIIPFLLSLGCVVSCGPSQEAERPPVELQSAADEIMRIGEVWTSAHSEKGILSPPSKISVFTTVVRSEIKLSEHEASEVLLIQEEVTLRAGGTVLCETRFEHPLRLKWGRRQQEAAVKLSRPPISGPRNCNGPHPEPIISRGEVTALFVVRSDELIPVEPPLEKRKYIPVVL